MAITLQPYQPYQPYQRPATLRTPLVRRQPTEPTGVLAGLMLTLVLFGVTTALLVTQVARTPAARASTPEPLQIFQSKTMVASSAEATTDASAPPVSEAVPSEDAAPDVMAAQAVPQAGPVTTEPPVASDAQPAAPPALAEPGVGSATSPFGGLAAGVQARVVNTDGMGVVLHDAPRKGARRPSGLLEGAKVTVLSMSEGEWIQVRAAGRPDGWVPAAYLMLIDERAE